MSSILGGGGGGMFRPLKTYRHDNPYRTPSVYRGKFNPIPPPLGYHVQKYIGSKKNIAPKYMPKKYTKKATKKRGVIRRRRIPTLTPKTKIVKVRDTIYLNHTGTTSLYLDNIQLNSCIDPFCDGSNKQPLGYDQWKALYQKAYVVGSKLILRFHNNGTSAVAVGVCPMPESQGTTALVAGGTAGYAYCSYADFKGNKQRILSQDVDHCTMVHKVSTKRFLGIKDIRDDDDSQLDLVNETDTTRKAYWHVYSQSLDGTTAYDVDLVATIEYIVLLTDPIIPSVSTSTTNVAG